MVLMEVRVGRILLIGFCLAVLVTSCRLGIATTSVSCAPGTRDETLVSGGQTRQYRIFVPPGYRPRKSVPLVIGFHGNGGIAAQFESYSGFSALAAHKNFIAVYPQGLGEPPVWDTWAGSQDVQFARDLIAAVEGQCAVDPTRVFAVGHSRGGGMANRLACDLSDCVAAAGSVSGAYQYGEDCQPTRPVPIVAFHGTGEAYFVIATPIPQWASDWAARNGCDPRQAEIFRQGAVTGQSWGNCRGGANVVLYTVGGGGHGWPGEVDAAQIIWTFFADHPTPPSTPSP